MSWNGSEDGDEGEDVHPGMLHFNCLSCHVCAYVDVNIVMYYASGYVMPSIMDSTGGSQGELVIFVHYNCNMCCVNIIV